ncbi:MAG: hypothetical protein FJ144_05835 [Deltaproteobacteria bacterium]|nr:hypothetical protein [Deltaproteobacteria bacterium]
MRTHRSFCRFCHAICGIEVDVEGNRAVAVRGDPAHPISKGYLCVKGRAPVSGIPRQSAIPVRVRALTPAELAAIAGEDGLSATRAPR